jgi:hypothetical protein
VKWPTTREQMLKVFCPTGEGGGIDPTCSPIGSYHAQNPHSWAPGSTIESRAAAFDALKPGAEVWVFHGTTNERADRSLRTGLKISEKPRRTAAEGHFGPGQGLSGLSYVASDPMNAQGFGQRVLAIKVPKRDIERSPEQAKFGSHVTTGKALAASDAVLIRDVPAGRIIDVTAHKQLPAVEAMRHYK